jgi:hypothetical protein
MNTAAHPQPLSPEYQGEGGRFLVCVIKTQGVALGWPNWPRWGLRLGNRGIDVIAKFHCSCSHSPSHTPSLTHSFIHFARSHSLSLTLSHPSSLEATPRKPILKHPGCLCRTTALRLMRARWFADETAA